MKRFNVTNIYGFQFTVEGESLESIYPNGLPPEWGKSERTEVNSEGNEIVIPVEYTIVEEDIADAKALELCHMQRIAEYPMITEFADAFVKMRAGNPEAMDAYVAKCLEVKAKYPKP